MSRIVQSVSHILALYPFEPALYRDTEVKCSYVGHPLADVIPLDVDQRAVRERLGLQIDRPVVALLPGSSQSELHFMAETFIETAKLPARSLSKAAVPRSAGIARDAAPVRNRPVEAEGG
jgi:lipid-A-disaccharide synthase